MAGAKYGLYKQHIERRYACEITIAGDRGAEGWEVAAMLWVDDVVVNSAIKKAEFKGDAVWNALVEIAKIREPLLQKKLQLARIDDVGQFYLFDVPRADKK